jgi:hypothetical protein
MAVLMAWLMLWAMEVTEVDDWPGPIWARLVSAVESAAEYADEKAALETAADAWAPPFFALAKA